MAQLARNVPTAGSVGPIEGGALLDDIQVNKWNLEANSVNEKIIAPAAVNTNALAASSITSDKIVIGGIHSANIAAGAVDSTIIADGSITTNKIQVNAVVSDRLAADSVTSDKIAANAVTSSEINAGAVTSGKISVTNLADINTLFAGSITISAASGGGEPSTGVYMTSTQLLMKSSGTAMVSLNASAGTYYFKGELFATKVTVESNAANSVNFGASVTIGGNLTVNGNIIVHNTDTDGAILFDTATYANSNVLLDYLTSSKYLYLYNKVSGGYIGINSGATAPYQSYLVLKNTSTASDLGFELESQTGGGEITIGSSASSVMSFRRGSTSPVTVFSYAGDANKVTFVGDVEAASVTATNLYATANFNVNSGGSSGVIYFGSGSTHYLLRSSDTLSWTASGTAIIKSAQLHGVHKTYAGSYKANTTITFYAASSSGGSPTTLHTVVFTDGLITSWS